MLARFSVKNFKSFKDEVVFDLSQTKRFEFAESCVRNGIVNNALIYGPNGSGKSNLGFALFDIVATITDKQRRAEAYANYLNADSDGEIAEFRFEFVFGESTLTYTYGKRSFEEIIYEHLYINEHPVLSYDRRNKQIQTVHIDLPGTETLIKDLAQIKISAVKYLKTNAVLQESKESSVFLAFFNFAERMLHFRNLDDRFYQGYEIGTRDIFEDILNNNNLQDFIRFLKKAEIDCDLEILKLNDRRKLAFRFSKRNIDFWESASTGTHALSLFYYWQQRMNRPDAAPSFVFIDEFDAFYHQDISEAIVRELIGRPYQTILTTHNTSLMTNDLLRPDCYFVLKNQKILSFSMVSDKDIRKAHNIEKMYRAGSFNHD